MGLCAQLGERRCSACKQQLCISAIPDPRQVQTILHSTQKQNPAKESMAESYITTPLPIFPSNFLR